jgi:hypothetical protein
MRHRTIEPVATRIKPGRPEPIFPMLILVSFVVLVVVAAFAMAVTL